MTSTLTVVGKRGKCTINVGKNDLELLPLLEVIYTDLWDRAHSHRRSEWSSEPFLPNLKGWLAEICGSLKGFVVVKGEQPERAINFLVRHGIIRIKLVEEEVLGNKVTFLCINAFNMPVIEEWEL
ncbi:hypothetical protein A3H65_01045 [Candidatus Giovannonibacteria bacterium RIFCSPLOWO2_02_FULL_45_14]|uniref:Uncharacterized protein n=1 Tax=Candidatus Giovannonibacteria bacterium RIFCSPLOWO2_12_FULL_44_15 TaxID=1798364 RepID=A0A1F5XZY8_9BACT|nr:MAG: hypothetical protein A3C75_01470 [Candidatus Giovannonibacteria bacterium RIFCSPHIGHO2_02_FULL_44_31]OGF76031.1 MAG: hypothetical protein A3E62_01880 [Candidatus Giovannonibacteria bacterium RIFCSPHIGHO2_12_FULL_44_29]OGF90927.1 MAG: hypothetical protein A3H65_01045 [Candidatus Giovannonibacteria bacterium RIFCSPLOWO2_02_FULL_45_14]OGF93446.1 MAG: hypothetical protein A3G54_04115 [Candidatus Giovannonibacteria bacterium RIFCSPLOWO2_12_FULL_44_15]